MGITFDNVSYRYKQNNNVNSWTLENIAVTLPANQFIVILGAPGSGKSTLLQHLNGLIRADHGLLHVLDLEIAPKPAKLPKELNKRVGLVFQYAEQQLFSTTIWEDLLYGPQNFKMSKEAAEDAARRAAADMGIEDELLSKSPYQLSSGQLRKAAIASVLAAEPEIIVLDEPTASLDGQSKVELLDLLYRQRHEKQRTVIVVTHALDDIMPYADFIVVLDEGRVAFAGQPLELMEQPACLAAAGLQLPKVYQLYQDLENKLGLPKLTHYPSAVELAKQLKSVFT